MVQLQRRRNANEYLFGNYPSTKLNSNYIWSHLEAPEVDCVRVDVAILVDKRPLVLALFKERLRATMPQSLV